MALGWGSVQIALPTQLRAPRSVTACRPLPSFILAGPVCTLPLPQHAPRNWVTGEAQRAGAVTPPHRGRRDEGQPVAGGSGLTLAGRRAGDAAWGVTDDSVPFHTGRVGRRVTKQAQQPVLLAEGWEGTDRQLHLGKAMWDSCWDPLPSPGGCQRGHLHQGACAEAHAPPGEPDAHCTRNRPYVVTPAPETDLSWIHRGPTCHRGWGTPQSTGSPSLGSAHRAQAGSETLRVSGPSPQLRQQRPCLARIQPPSSRTSPLARRLMFCGWAPVTATQDSSRLHSQWPLSSARGHSALLVHLQGQGTASVLVPVGPRAGLCPPGPQGGRWPPDPGAHRPSTTHQPQ